MAGLKSTEAGKAILDQRFSSADIAVVDGRVDRIVLTGVQSDGTRVEKTLYADKAQGLMRVQFTSITYPKPGEVGQTEYADSRSGRITVYPLDTLRAAIALAGDEELKVYASVNDSRAAADHGIAADRVTYHVPMGTGKSRRVFALETTSIREFQGSTIVPVVR